MKMTSSILLVLVVSLCGACQAIRDFGNFKVVGTDAGMDSSATPDDLAKSIDLRGFYDLMSVQDLTGADLAGVDLASTDMAIPDGTPCNSGAGIYCSGFCVAWQTDINNCGTCGHVCTAPSHGGTATCSGGGCVGVCPGSPPASIPCGVGANGGGDCCTSHDSCGGGGTSGICGCTPHSKCQGVCSSSGLFNDGCGNSAYCTCTGCNCPNCC